MSTLQTSEPVSEQAEIGVGPRVSPPPYALGVIEQMPTPRAVELLLARLPHVPPERLPGVRRELMLSYHYGGLFVATRHTPAGLEALAAGPMEEVFPAVQKLPRAEPEDIVVLMPEYFEYWLASILPRAPVPTA